MRLGFLLICSRILPNVRLGSPGYEGTENMFCFLNTLIKVLYTPRTWLSFNIFFYRNEYFLSKCDSYQIYQYKVSQKLLKSCPLPWGDFTPVFLGQYLCLAEFSKIDSKMSALNQSKKGYKIAYGKSQ